MLNTTKSQVETAIGYLLDENIDVKWVFTTQELLVLFQDVLEAHNLKEKYEQERVV